MILEVSFLLDRSKSAQEAGINCKLVMTFVAILSCLCQIHSIFHHFLLYIGYINIAFASLFNYFYTMLCIAKVNVFKYSIDKIIIVMLY